MARRSGLAAAALVPAFAAPAAADTVTTLADSGPGSLRAAIAATPAGGTVTFEAGLQGTILLADQLTIDKDLTIDGPSAEQLAVSGNDVTRVFQIFGPDTEVTIDDVTIRDGRAQADEPIGAGVWFIQGEALTLRRVAVVANEAVDTTGVTPLGGGITVFDGRFELHDSTVADNHASGGTGGGIFVGTPAEFAVSNSTIAGNEARGGAGFVSANAEGTISAGTIAGNEAADQPGGGVLASGPAVVTLTRSLLTQNTAATGPDCQGQIATAGGNVIATDCLAAPAAGDATGVTAAVGPLGDHGGPTPTVLPLAGNPAVDHVAAPCPGADQRDIARPQGAGCDAGAVELRAQLSSAGALALGSAFVGEYSAAVSTVVTNTGERAVTITGVTLAGSAEIERVADPDECTGATVLAPGETCVLMARLAPTSPGAKSATFSVAIAGSTLDVAVTGHGDAVPLTPPPGGGPPPADPQPTVTPSAQAALVGASTKARRGGKLKLRLRCTTVAAPRCTGTLTLKLGARRLARAFTIVAGRDAVVTLKLGAGDRRRLARKRSLRSAVTVVTTQPDGSRRTTHRGTFKLLRS